MNKLFFVSYDLIAGKNYSKISSKLQSMRAEKVLLSLWALRGNYTASTLLDTLKAYVDSDDRLLVIESNDWASIRALVDVNKVA